MLKLLMKFEEVLNHHYWIIWIRCWKFEPKGKTIIFVGYAVNAKGYWLFNPRIKVFTFARDVKFYENVFDFAERQTGIIYEFLDDPKIIHIF